MKTEKITTILSELDNAIKHFYSRNYYLAAKFAIIADYKSSDLINEPFYGVARVDSAANNAMMIAMTTHGIGEINLLDDEVRDFIYTSIQRQWLNDFLLIRNEILNEGNSNKRRFTSEEYRNVTSESISNTIINIILGRLQLPIEITAVTRYCDDARLSNPYRNSENWQGKLS